MVFLVRAAAGAESHVTQVSVGEDVLARWDIVVFFAAARKIRRVCWAQERLSVVVSGKGAQKLHICAAVKRVNHEDALLGFVVDA